MTVIILIRYVLIVLIILITGIWRTWIIILSSYAGTSTRTGGARNWARDLVYTGTSTSSRTSRNIIQNLGVGNHDTVIR